MKQESSQARHSKRNHVAFQTVERMMISMLNTTQASENLAQQMNRVLKLRMPTTILEATQALAKVKSL
jgi:hypothetical protein